MKIKPFMQQKNYYRFAQFCQGHCEIKEISLFTSALVIQQKYSSCDLVVTKIFPQSNSLAKEKNQIDVIRVKLWAV